jgi:hypothetical protein
MDSNDISSTFTFICSPALTFEKCNRPFEVAPFLVTFKEIVKLGMSQMPAHSYVVIRGLFDEDQIIQLTADSPYKAFSSARYFEDIFIQ